MSTAIEWTDETWNPVTGCTEVSPGCDHCYAKTFAERWRGTPGHHFEQGFDVVLRPERLEQPLRWKRPRRIFVNSMSDLFHGQVPDEFIVRVWAVMSAAPQHTFQILTKRHGRMRALLSRPDFERMVLDAKVGPRWAPLPGGGWQWPLPNVWLGVSVETQQWADIRIPALLDTPAAVRFLSCEPLLGPVTLDRTWLGVHHDGTHHGSGAPDCPRDRHLHHDSKCQRVGWVIVGGESGHGGRPMHRAWAESLRDQCTTAGIPFLFKQWGEWKPTPRLGVGALANPNRERYGEVVVDDEQRTWHRIYERLGKKAAGRVLDGRTWDEFPEAVAGS